MKKPVIVSLSQSKYNQLFKDVDSIKHGITEIEELIKSPSFREELFELEEAPGAILELLVDKSPGKRNTLKRWKKLGVVSPGKAILRRFINNPKTTLSKTELSFVQRAFGQLVIKTSSFTKRMFLYYSHTPSYHELAGFDSFCKDNNPSHLEAIIDLEVHLLKNDIEIVQSITKGIERASYGQVLDWWRGLVTIARHCKEKIDTENKTDTVEKYLITRQGPKYLGKVTRTYGDSFNSFEEKEKELEGLVREFAKRSGLFRGRGGRPKKFSIHPSDLKTEYETVCAKLKTFFQEQVPNHITEKKIGKRSYAYVKKSMHGKLLNKVMVEFYFECKELGIPYLPNLGSKPVKDTNTIEKIAKFILAYKYKSTQKTISQLLKPL